METVYDDVGGNETDSNSTNEGSPGFGLGASLSVIAGVIYVLKRRFESDA